MSKHILYSIFSDKKTAIKYQKYFQDQLGLTLARKKLDSQTEYNLSEGDKEK